MARIIDITLGEKVDSRVQETKSGSCTIYTYEVEFGEDTEVVDVWDWKNETEPGQRWRVEYRESDRYNPSAFLKERLDYLPKESDQEMIDETTTATQPELVNVKRSVVRADNTNLKALELTIQLFSGPKPTPNIEKLETYYKWLLEKLK